MMTIITTMGGVLAELLVKEGHSVSVVTAASEVSTWMRMTMEQLFVQHRLVNLGVKIVLPPRPYPRGRA